MSPVHSICHYTCVILLSVHETQGGWPSLQAWLKGTECSLVGTKSQHPVCQPSRSPWHCSAPPLHMWVTSERTPTGKPAGGQQKPREDIAKHGCREFALLCSGFPGKPQLQGGLAIRDGVISTEALAENILWKLKAQQRKAHATKILFIQPLQWFLILLVR